MDDVNDLVVTPFRDMVEKGRTAIENAGDDKPMLKASQALVKEGERALKRIEPLCRKHLDEYGSNFVDALKENDDIGTFRSELTDLLWEFDDYIELDDFEPEKFAELQAMSRKAAPKIYDILMRMKLEVPFDHDARSIMTRMSAPRSPPMSPSPPPVPSLFPYTSAIVDTPPVPPIPPQPVAAPPRPAADPPTVEAATDQLRMMMHSKSGPDEGLYGDFPEPPKQQQLTPIEPPPRPPSANPWDVKTPPPAPELRMRDDFAFERRAPVAPVESPVEPISPPTSPETGPRGFSTARPRPLNMAIPNRSSQISNESRLSPTGLEPVTYERTYNVFPGQSPRGRYSNTTSIMSSSIPEDDVSHRESQGRFSQPTSKLPPVYDGRAPPSRPESLDSELSSVFDQQRRTDGATTPMTADNRGSTISGLQNSPTLGTSPMTPIYVKPLPVPPMRHSSRGSAKTPTPPPQIPLPPPPTQINGEQRRPRHERREEYQNDEQNGYQNSPQNGFQTEQAPVIPEIDYGPIPVDSELVEPVHPPNPHAIDCRITSLSSFYLQKAFCEGAQEVMRGGIGIKKTKKAGFASTATIGRCIKCLFELDFHEIELDLHKADRGNFVKHGIGFRIRFLQKCHISTRRSDDILYGCLFCVHLGRTLHASDATVFTSQKALFAHLARHPRPLPDIPGLVVVDGEHVPEHMHNDYDLHFKEPVETHPVIEKGEDLSLLPTGTSREVARRMYGQRLLLDKTPALEMAQGAKIIGISWPDKYVGEWAFGWHDGNFASLPTEILKLDPPPESEVEMAGTSQIQVTAKWKFNPKDKKGTDWLKFDKDEVLSNVNWAYQDHWCWSGTNAKGKWGIFPQAFVDVNTVREAGGIPFAGSGGSDRASVLSSEKAKSGSVLSRFGSRMTNRSGGRPASVAGSTGSHETPPAPSVYY
ncbi:hypothetical protein B0J13DRAFT_281763 [Dactylonectria estremocensis]|uniref:SH3 domain-containing protein n=1 Tax=Dactylonectria estremocensis TaxID=1079267 RepID=A0A9P9F2T6_9HYPO|nr:hypothetical protein B0J13DRAFT_281763 [Dactylonectria estremocensis]